MFFFIVITFTILMLCLYLGISTCRIVHCGMCTRQGKIICFCLLSLGIILVYMAKAEKLLFIQQRATFVKGKRKQFREKLLQWIRMQNFQTTFLIGSMFAHMRSDQQINGYVC